MARSWRLKGASFYFISPLLNVNSKRLLWAPTASKLTAVKSTRTPSATSALSEQFDTLHAALEIVESIHDQTDGESAVRPDILCVFASGHHRGRFADAIDLFRSSLHPAHILGSTVESVICNTREVERSAGLSVLALTLPNVVVRPFWFDTADGPPAVWDRGFIRERVSLPPDEGAGHGALTHRGIIMLSDPHSFSSADACAAIDDAAGPQGARIFGGIASGAHHAGLNVLAVDRRLSHSGAVGLSIFGDVALDGFMSQGCSPIGPRFIITKAHDHTIVEIGGKRAIDAAREMLDALPESMRQLVEHGILIGIARDAAKRNLGRDDFIVRLTLGVDQDTGSFTLSHPVRAGMTMQFYVRDAVGASQDLSMCLDAEQLREPVVAALLLTCSSRGSSLFGAANHDAEKISRRLAGPPIAGCSCAGEFAIREHRTYVHCHAASAVMFRALHP